MGAYLCRMNESMNEQRKKRMNMMMMDKNKTKQNKTTDWNKNNLWLVFQWFSFTVRIRLFSITITGISRRVFFFFFFIPILPRNKPFDLHVIHLTEIKKKLYWNLKQANDRRSCPYRYHTNVPSPDNRAHFVYFLCTCVPFSPSSATKNYWSITNSFHRWTILHFHSPFLITEEITTKATITHKKNRTQNWVNWSKTNA